MDYIKSAFKNNSNMMFALIIVIGIIIALLYVFKFKFNIMENFASSNSDTNNSNSSPVEILLFHTDWCPHCKTAKPEWDKISEEYSSKTVNDRKIIFKDINCTTETAETEQLMTKYKVEGFPTIKLLKEGNVVDFDAKPIYSNLVSFINTVV